MQQWIIYGLLASLFFGINVIFLKIASTRGVGLNPYTAAFAYGIGAFILFSLVYFFKLPRFNNNWDGVIFAVIAGAIWALGLVMVSVAIVNKGDISKLAPLYNTNTLIAVLLGIIFLKEIPAGTEIIKVVSGAVLIVIGAILVSS